MEIIEKCSNVPNSHPFPLSNTLYNVQCDENQYANDLIFTADSAIFAETSAIFADATIIYNIARVGADN